MLIDLTRREIPAVQGKTMIAPGATVFLRACHVGQPGTVIREHRGKLTVYWPDLDHWSHHRPEALEIAEPVSGAPATTNAQGERAQ